MSTRDATPTQFVVLASARTGSNMLVSLLDQHPQVRCVGEAFNPQSSFGYQRWVARTGLRRLVSRFANDYCVTEYLASLLSTREKPGARAVGYKVIYPGQFDRWTGFRCHWRTHDVKIINLVRHNLLRKYVSAQIASADDKWSAREARAQAARITIRVDDLEQHFARSETIYRLMETLTVEFRGIRISYEDLSSSRVPTMTRVLEYIGVDTGDAGSMAPATIRQNPAPLAELVENFDELCAALRDTPYASFLES